MTSAEKIETAKQYLRWKYALDLPGLKTLADTVAAGAFDAVTITGDSHEGTSSSGQVTFEPLEYLRAVMQVLGELDPTAPQDAPLTIYSDFSYRQVMT